MLCRLSQPGAPGAHFKNSASHKRSSFLSSTISCMITQQVHQETFPSLAQMSEVEHRDIWPSLWKGEGSQAEAASSVTAEYIALRQLQGTRELNYPWAPWTRLDDCGWTWGPLEAVSNQDALDLGLGYKHIRSWMKRSPNPLRETCLQHYLTNKAGGQVTYSLNREQHFKSIRHCSELAISQKVHNPSQERLRYDKYFLKRVSSFQNLHTTVLIIVMLFFFLSPMLLGVSCNFLQNSQTKSRRQRVPQKSTPINTFSKSLSTFSRSINDNIYQAQVKGK